MRGMRGWIGVAWLAAAMPAWAQVDLDPYLKKDDFEEVKISPDGRYYAITVPLEDRTVLAVLRRSDKVPTARVGKGKNSVVADYWWVSDERLVVAMAEKYGSEDRPYRSGELHAINADGSQPRLLISPYESAGGAQPEAAYVIDTLPGDDRNILVEVVGFGANPQPRVVRLDVYNGRRFTVANAPVRRADFTTDTAGVVRFAQGADNTNASKLYYRDGNDGEWRLINDEAQSGRVETPLGFSADNRHAYLQATRDDGPDAIVELDATSGARRELLRDPAVDPFAIIYRADADVPEGAFFMHDRMRTRFFDEASATARSYRALEEAFAGQSVGVTSTTRDGVLQVVQVWNDRSPGDFYLFNTKTHSADLIFSLRAWFDPTKTATTREVELKARDGLTLHGFLTVADGAEAKNLPMVVVPHGGPYGVFDQWEFDDDAQLLAQAGYAVLRLNYRGSGNYGRKYLEAGAQEWGGAMQDDLTDATRWAIEQKIADPARICIYGASYGGYAALMGVAKEPGLYRCAVGYVGVYDLELMHRQKSRAAKWVGAWQDDWVGARGSLAAVSPTTLAAKVKVPVFLAAGGEDDVAPIAHSRKMEKALKAAGVPVETLYFDTEGHGFYAEPHRREFYVRLLDFLARNIGGAKAKGS